MVRHRFTLLLLLAATVSLLYGFGPPGLGSNGCGDSATSGQRGFSPVAVDPTSEAPELFKGGTEAYKDRETTDAPCMCEKNQYNVVTGPCTPEKPWTCSGDMLVSWDKGGKGCRTWAWDCGGSCIEDGPQGTGCYPSGTDLGDGRVEVCEPLATHPWSTDFSCKDVHESCRTCCEQGIEWQLCVRTPAMVRPPDFNPQTDCTYSFRLNGVDVPVGDCTQPGNLGMNNGPNTCLEACPAPKTPDAGGGVDPSCASQINSLKNSFPCSHCVDDFISCMKASNCKNLSFCQSTAIACVQSC